MGTHLAVVCQYHKSGSITGKDKVIPHSLDAVSSDLVIQDLSIARPFAELAAYICYPHSPDIQAYYKSHLFVNNKNLFTTTDITNVLKTYTLPVYDIGLGVNDWRHISAAFRRKICPGLEDIVEDDNTQETVQALQSGHTRQTENRIYGISTEALAGSADEVLPMFLDASTDWQVACRVVPGGHLLPYKEARMEFFDQLSSAQTIKSNYSTPISTMEQALDHVIKTLNSSLEAHTETLLTKLEPKLEQMMEKIIHRLAFSPQASHHPVAPQFMPTPPESVMSFSQKKPPNNCTPQLANFDNICPAMGQQSSRSPSTSLSQSSEDFEDFQIQDQEPLKEDTTQVLEPKQQNIDMRKKNQMHQAADIIKLTDIAISRAPDPYIVDNTITINNTDEQDALHILRRFTNNSNATWKTPLQWQAIKEVLKMSDDILLVMATGGGKTMVAIIPTLIDGNVSVIVLPLNSLITDYKRKFDAMGILYDHYTSSTKALKQNVHFIFVSADMAKTASWKQCILDLNDHVEVTRLFFDEAHLPLLSNDFRAALNHLSDLRVLPMQFILLTATAPPSSEKALYKRFGLCSSNTLTLRGLTNRPELFYDIRPHAHTYDEALSIVKESLSDFGKEKQPRDAALIFVPYIDIGERLAQDLGCNFYSGKIRDPAHREQIYLSWFNGNNSILVATSALKMMGYVQEVSRGGRNGQPTKCLLIPMSKKQPRPTQDEDYTGVNAMYNFVWKEKNCFRYAITLFFDGIGVYCQDSPGCSPCRNRKIHHPVIYSPAIIQSSPEPLPHSEAASRKRKSIGKTTTFEAQLCAAKKRKTERSLEVLKYVEVFKTCLAIFQSSCAYCIVFQKTDCNHELFKCPVLHDKLSDYKAWKKSITYNPKHSNKTYWFCHVPQCHDLLHPQFTTPEDCDYPDIVAPVAFAIFQIDEYRHEAENHFQAKWKSIKAFTE
ncbi:hypothetical protein BYT27DRAFT_7260412 [Phlegmacium glaucopus]|nr:hypothetical protein BYT27DRAFT_7260412 [Phlegmacium glaucopus]